MISIIIMITFPRHSNIATYSASSLCRLNNRHLMPPGKERKNKKSPSLLITASVEVKEAVWLHLIVDSVPLTAGIITHISCVMYTRYENPDFLDFSDSRCSFLLRSQWLFTQFPAPSLLSPKDLQAGMPSTLLSSQIPFCKPPAPTCTVQC